MNLNDLAVRVAGLWPLALLSLPGAVAVGVWLASWLAGAVAFALFFAAWSVVGPGLIVVATSQDHHEKEADL